MHKLAVLSCVIFLAACSSPPKAPTVKWSKRAPVNDVRTAELLSQRAEISDAQSQLSDQSRQPVVVAAAQESATEHEIVSVNFPYNSSAFRPTEAEALTLRSLLGRDVRHGWVRGRTDGKRPSGADERIALNRALAAKNWLVAQGVSRLKISVNYVSAGDYVADNTSAVGRAQNRRVDIEVLVNR